MLHRGRIFTATARGVSAHQFSGGKACRDAKNVMEAMSRSSRVRAAERSSCIAFAEGAGPRPCTSWRLHQPWAAYSRGWHGGLSATVIAFLPSCRHLGRISTEPGCRALHICLSFLRVDGFKLFTWTGSLSPKAFFPGAFGGAWMDLPPVQLDIYRIWHPHPQNPHKN